MVWPRGRGSQLLANPWTVTRCRLAGASINKGKKISQQSGNLIPAEAKVLVVKLDSIGEKLADCDPLMSHQG